MKFDIYNYEKRQQTFLANSLENNFMERNGWGRKPTVVNLSEQDKKDIRDYCTHLIRNGVSSSRIMNHLYKVRLMYGMCRKSLRDATREDYERIVDAIDRLNIVPMSKAIYKIVLKHYIKWLRGWGDKDKDAFPEEIAWLKIQRSRSNIKLPEEILTEEEIMKLAENTCTLRDRAFILGLYESGCRISEFLLLQIKHIQFDEYGCVLWVTGKTGDRRVRLISSSPTIAEWLEHHPFRNEPQAYVWIRTNTKNPYRPLTYRLINYVLKETATKVGIKKRINPHSFRHARATHLANVLTESQMREHFGWTKNSNMTEVYVHLSGRDLDHAILKAHGLVANGEQTPKLVTKVCEKCKTVNDPVAMFCKKCRYPIDATEKRRVIDEVVFELLTKLAEQNPSVKDTFKQIVKEKGLEDWFK